jgi:hypothetical protein
MCQENPDPSQRKMHGWHVIPTYSTPSVVMLQRRVHFELLGNPLPVGHHIDILYGSMLPQMQVRHYVMHFHSACLATWCPSTLDFDKGKGKLALPLCRGTSILYGADVDIHRQNSYLSCLHRARGGIGLLDH